jgi:hypothetical protein
VGELLSKHHRRQFTVLAALVGVLRLLGLYGVVDPAATQEAL